jgi:hypothetical protein
VPEDTGAAKPVGDPSDLETPDPDTRTENSRKRWHDRGCSEMRKVSAEDVAHDIRPGQQEGNDA